MADEEKKEEGKKEHGFLWKMIRENIQDFLIIVSIFLGARKAPKEGETLPSGKQVPGWLLSALPSWTDEDEVEYNMTLSSHASPDAILSTEEFEENLQNESRWDEVKFRVRLLKIHREFLDQLRSPAPEDKSGGRLKFSPAVVNDPVIQIMDRFLAEKEIGETEQEVFERQKEIANRRKLLERKSLLRRLSENKLLTFFLLALLLISLPFIVFDVIWLIYKFLETAFNIAS